MDLTRAHLTSEFAKLAPWIFKFRIGGADYGGEISCPPRCLEYFSGLDLPLLRDAYGFDDRVLYTDCDVFFRTREGVAL